MSDHTEPDVLPQGSLDLLKSATAQRLLASNLPARFAYVSTDGTPRVVPTWFHWTGDELVMPTFISAPHVRHPAARRYLAPEEATAYLAQIDRPITRMARIAVRPSWVGVVDFRKRLPSALGGVSG